ncbi:hypothetical protein A5893_06500 [Pedobacter psychrophilus]|uniref:Uncharacterized protein n=1 Tax=Pedobacter psychrophilus TaxID=1826909 RepID=A0A179DIQ1_9SPHI|nr:hypothetical protein [Pedobacter psychrophilus]OAQ40590.1 hypothetical protein A5893_06500 [Pedobacter psychrophilus]
MKISSKSIASKFSLTAFALVLMQTLSFAADKVPDVYVSRSAVSHLSGQQLLDTTWFWILITIVVLVFITAYFAAGTAKKTGQPHLL